MGGATIRTQALRGVAWTFGQNSAARVASLVTFIVLARFLEPENFGVVALAAVFISIINSLADGGFASYLIQSSDVDQRTTSTAFWSVMTMSILSSGLLALSAPLWAMLLRTPELTSVLRWLALGIVLTGASSTQVALLKRRLAFKLLALRSMVAMYISAAVAIVLAWAGAGVWSLVAQSLTLAGVSALILWTAAGWRPSLAFSWPTARSIARYGASVAGSRIVNAIRTQGDDLVIGAVLGPVALGYWSVAMRIHRVLFDTGISVISMVAAPVFARLKGQPDKVRSAYVKAVSLGLVVMGPLAAAVAIVSPTLVPMLFGPLWDPSGDLARIVVLSGIATSIVFFDRGLLLALGRPGLELKLTVATTLVGLVLVTAATPFGLAAVAVAGVLRPLLLWPFRLRACTRLLDMPARPFVVRVLLLLLVTAVGAAPAAVFVEVWGNELPVALTLTAVPMLVLLVTLPGIRWCAPDLWKEVRSLVPRRRRRVQSSVTTSSTVEISKAKASA